MNLYTYCGNNAVMYEDPSGYASKCDKSEDNKKITKVEGNLDSVKEIGKTKVGINEIVPKQTTYR